MAHGHRGLQQFNQWLSQHQLGAMLLAAEQQAMTQLLKEHMGKHVLLIGVPKQDMLLTATDIPCHTIIGPLPDNNKSFNYIESDFHDLPLHTGSIDLVILPHILEFIDNPRQLLSEACRVIKPEGLILVCGFNPISLWGIKKLLTKEPAAPWSGNFFNPSKIKKWLQLADFALERQQFILFTPPIESPLYQKMRFLEFLGKHFFARFGGVYVLSSRAKVIPLTPIRMQWKQRLNGLRISTSIPGHVARFSK